MGKCEHCCTNLTYDGEHDVLIVLSTVISDQIDLEYQIMLFSMNAYNKPRKSQFDCGNV